MTERRSGLSERGAESAALTEHTLELALLLPREAECGGCVEEVTRELGRVDGVHAIEADVSRGLLSVHFDEGVLDATAVRTYARRAGAQAHCSDHCPLAVHDHGQLDLLTPLPGEDGSERRILHVTGMDCADCAVKLQGALRRETGVRRADVNFGAATLVLAIDPSRTDLDRVYTAVRRLGYDTLERAQEKTAARPQGAGAAVRTSSAAPTRGFWLSDRRAALTLVSGMFIVAGFVAEAVWPAASPWLFAAAMVAGGAFVARAAFFSLRARQVDMNVLMTLAAVGAAAIGQWSEAGLVTFLFGLGTVLQVATLERTRRAITGLMALTPPEAAVLRDGQESTVPLEEVRPGDVVLARPGQRVAVDGIVINGHAAADQSQVTGESRPVAKAPGDQVFAGSIVEGGTLRLRATAAGSDNTVARIVHLVEEAQAQRAPAQSIVDRFAARYTPAVVALAAAVAFVPPLFGAPFDTWFYRGLALLIISCPCALVISTPVSILAALARATRNGVLIKGGVFLEQAAGLKAVAVDKTGTLTVGRPQVTDVVAVGGASEDEVLDVAAALERLSEHPLARAVLARAGAHGCGCDDSAPDACACDGPARTSRADHVHESREDHAHAPVVERFRAIPGKGVRGEIGGRLCFAGRPELLGVHAADPELVAAVSRLEREGKTAVAVGDERGALGVIAVSDPLRDGAAEAVARLRALGVEHITMLTGDNAETAAAIAAQAGIDDVRAGLLPADKVAAVAELRDRYDAVAMVGDGVNDAPALATATLGIAMGAAGTDAALQTADIALMGDDLTAVPGVILLGRRTKRIIWQNIVFSIAVKGLFLVLAPLGLVSLWLAVFADMGTSLLVTANGLRLFRR
jgi:Zn2+/Cd2+-exporting ATPase